MSQHVPFTILSGGHDHALKRREKNQRESSREVRHKILSKRLTLLTSFYLYMYGAVRAVFLYEPQRPSDEA